MSDIFGPNFGATGFNPPPGHQVTVGPHAPANQEAFRRGMKETFPPRDAKAEPPLKPQVMRAAAEPTQPPVTPPAPKAKPLGELDKKAGLSSELSANTMSRGDVAPALGPTEPYPQPVTTAPPPEPVKPAPKTMSGASAITQRLLKEKELRDKKLQDEIETKTQAEALPPMKTRMTAAAEMPVAPLDPNAPFVGPPQVASGMKIATLLRLCGVPDAITHEESMLVEGIRERRFTLVKMATDSESAVLANDESHPIALALTMGAKYGPAWLGWEPETIEETVLQDFGLKISDIIENKLMAIKTVVEQPEIMQSDWHAFEKMCVAFDGKVPRMSIIEDLSPEAMTFGVLCAKALLHGNFEPTPNLKRYIACRLFDAGFVVPPPALGYVDAELKAINPETLDEGLRKSVLMRYAEVLGGSDGVAPAGEAPAINIQVGRLLRCNAYAIDKADDLIRQLE